MQRLKLICLLASLLVVLSGCQSVPPVCQLPAIPEWMMEDLPSSTESLNKVISPIETLSSEKTLK